jgi:deoxyribodipyrimidine photo-lyase
MILQGAARYPVREIILHCSATRPEWMGNALLAAKLAEIRRWHMQDRGWRNIGYHWLLDFDLAANNGGWQWAASSGCDAQPYFRIFNPITQSEKFDTEGKFIRRYLPVLEKLSKKSIHAPWEAGHIELEAAGIVLGRDYPMPVVDHDEARKKTLVRYSVVKKIA